MGDFLDGRGLRGIALQNLSGSQTVAVDMTIGGRRRRRAVERREVGLGKDLLLWLDGRNVMSRSSASELAAAETAMMESATGSKVGAGIVLTETVGHVRTGLTVSVPVGVSIGSVFSRNERPRTVTATHVVLGTTIALRE